MSIPKPKRGCYFTPDDVARAKDNIKKFAWGENAYHQMKRECDEFLLYGDEQIYACILGMKDQVFAYGIAGCPNCGKPFPMHPEEQKTMFSSIDALPLKTVTCPGCRMTFPNERFDDRGQGVEANGKGYYLIGMWNFFTGGRLLGGVHDHEGLVTKLTYMYMLTGNEAYASRALLILDAFSAIAPGTIGPRDFTPFGSDFEIGRLHMLTSIVHRIKVCLAQDYDWLYERPELDRPSPALEMTGQQGTMRQNIERMLNDYMLSEPGGPAYDLHGGNLTNLQNHESDGVRAMLAVGLVLSNEDYCKWGIRAVEAFFYNAIGRDGMYYEGSYGYSLFAATVFLDMAVLAMRASTRRQLESFHPFSCERFFRFAVENPLTMLCQGHLPCYGDWGRDTIQGRSPDQRLVAETYRAALFFYQFTPDPHMRQRAEKTLLQLYPIMEDQLGTRGVDLFFGHPTGAKSEPFRLPNRHTVKGQAGIGILRDANETTVLMRIGQNNTHTHDDVLAYTYYAFGKEVSADLGYSIYGTNSHFGWSSKSVAHNTVVVNEDEGMRAGQIYKAFSGGEFSLLFESEHLTAIEGRAPELYNIDRYERFLGVVPFADGVSYVMDFFTISGARTTDYAYRAFHENSTLSVEGATSVAGNFWTLAGVEAESKPYFDEPGRSFGERLTTGGTFRELLDAEQERLWTPEKNNGYGYIFDVKRFIPNGPEVRAVWKSVDGYSLHWLGLCDDGDQILTGLCPSLEGETRHPVFIVRSTREWKRYRSAAYVCKDAEAGAHVERLLPLAVNDDRAEAVAVVLSTGMTDLWVHSPVERHLAIQTPFGEWVVSGRCAWMRIDPNGNIRAAECIQADEMSLGQAYFVGPKAERMRVVELDAKASTLWLSGKMPGDAELRPQYVRVFSQGGGGSALYPLRSVELEGDRVKAVLQDSMVLSKGTVEKSTGDLLEVDYPIPLGHNGDADSGVSSMKGKRMVGAGKGLAVIHSLPEFKKIRVKPIVPFEVGESFDIVDIAPGDELEWVFVNGTRSRERRSTKR